MELVTHSPILCKQEQSDSPVFICAVGRSGTTLLANMLSSHPNLAIFHESDLFDRLHHYKRFFNFQNDRVLESVLDHLFTVPGKRTQKVRFPEIYPLLASLKPALLSSDRKPETLYKIILSTWSQSLGKKRWGDKHSHLIDKIPQLVKAYPHAKFIHIIRDPRAVCHSIIKVNNRSSFKTPFQDISVHRMADIWIRGELQFQRNRKYLNLSQLFELRYEDMVKNPAAELTRLCEFLGESYHPEMLDYYLNLPERYKDRQALFPGFHENLHQPVSSIRIDKWKEMLSLEQIGIIERITAKIMKQYGYYPDERGGKIPVKEELYTLAYKLSSPVRRWVRKAQWEKRLKEQMKELRNFMAL